MGTSDVLKVITEIARAVGECNLRTFKTSPVTINHQIHEQVQTISRTYKITEPQRALSLVKRCVYEYNVNTVVTFQICAYF